MWKPADLDRLLPRADIVLVTVPLTRETRQLIGKRELDLMKPEAGLINMGRARVVDYDALAAKLTRGELSGAILDVFDPEPLPADSPLWTTPHLLISPHVSSDDVVSYVPRHARPGVRERSPVPRGPAAQESRAAGARVLSASVRRRA